jgi:hypothetical protein
LAQIAAVDSADHTPVHLRGRGDYYECGVPQLSLVELVEGVPKKRYTCKPCPNPDAALVGFCSICDLAPFTENACFQ